MTTSHFWRIRSFQLVMVAVGQFVVLTTVAMLVYPGGTGADKTTAGYSFFTNFFSDLGLTRAHNGASNGLAMPLFVAALGLAGLGLMLFFAAFTQFFRHGIASRVLSAAGTVFGLGAGACFIGVALTPADVFRQAHGQFVLFAFGLFFLAATTYCGAMAVDRSYPTRYALIFAAFAVCLGAYLWLLTQGPRSTPDAIPIQATGQKLIVYAALASVGAQSAAAMRVSSRTGTRSHEL